MLSSQAEGAPAFWVMVARTGAGGGGVRQGADDIITMIHDVRWWQSRGGRERRPGRPRWSGTGAGRGLEEEDVEEEDAGPLERCPQLVAAEPFLVLVTY